MGDIRFENVKEGDDGYKIYFTSYLRKDFVEKSIVITLDSSFVPVNIFLSSYEFGSLEWINGHGLTECRKWETEEQAESAGYLARRFTTRISNGPAPYRHAEELLIPDILNSIEDKEFACYLDSILKSKSRRKKFDLKKYLVQ